MNAVVRRGAHPWGRAFGARVLGLALLEVAVCGAFALKLLSVLAKYAARLFLAVALLYAAMGWFGHEPHFLGVAGVQLACALGCVLLRAALILAHDRMDMAGMAGRRSGVSFHD